MNRPIKVAHLLLAASLSLPAASPAPAQAPNGWIQSDGWLILGPLGNGAGCDPGAAVAANWIAPEEISSITPEAGDPAAIDFNLAASDSWQGIGDEPVWSCIADLGMPASDLVNLEAIAGAQAAASGKAIPTTFVMAVLVTYVNYTGPDPLPVSICTASDDSIQVWVNDQRVQEVRACRGTAGGCAEESEGLLVPGTNAIKVLVWQGELGWSFRLRLKRLDTGPITSNDPEFSFGCEPEGPPAALNAFSIQRRFSTGIPECAVLGGKVEVVLDGEAGAGADVTVTETLIGAVVPENITAGGVFTPAPLPAQNPVGIFDGAVDAGSPCSPGSTVLNPDGSYTVTGSGFDIWTEGDGFQFAYRLAHGDFTMTARVAQRQWAPGSRWGKVGLMARQSLSGRSRYAAVQTHGEDLQDADRFAARPTHGGSNNFEQTSLPPAEHRDWMRLVRSGSRFTGFFSIDGFIWEEAGAADWGADAPHTVLLGLAVCSHAGCEPATITFDQVEISGGDQNPGLLAPDGGTIVWTALPRSTLDAGVGYRLSGAGQVALHGNDGEHAIEGSQEILLQPAAAAVGIFSSAHDIGQPCGIGSTVFDPAAQTYTITGGGNDIWEGDDQFQYAYTDVKGDFSLRARLDDRQWTPGARWGKGGLMARQTCEADSRYSFLHDSPEPDSTRFAVQRTSDRASNQEFGTGGHPAWLRLDRIDNVFAGYTSDDGIVWLLRHREAWIDPVPETVLAGLALTSNDGCATSTLVFDQVTLSPIDYSVARRVETDLPGCPPPGGGSPAKVELKGTGPAGPNVLVSETVQGQVEVGNISHGGVFTPFGKPAYTPVGIWHDARDIGAPCTPGSTLDNGDGSYTVTGSGADIWQGGDQFQFAYREASGDFSLTARIAERTWAAGSRWGKVGLMARLSHDSLSRYVCVQDHGIDLQDQTRWASRPTHAGSDNYETVPLPLGVHHDWLRLERIGDTFIGSSSADGVDWIQQGRETWERAPRTVLLGLEVCSHMDCLPASIRFDSIDLEGGDGAPGTVSEGGTIAWNVPRDDLAGGLSYELTAPGNAFALLSGNADGVEITGDVNFAIAPTADLPGELSIAHDIGNPCSQGSTEFEPASGVYTVTGSGSDIWQGGDQFQFAYRQVPGDYFAATARIAERRWAPGSRWGKVGIMAREDCTPRSLYAMIQDHGEDLQDQTRLAVRPTHGGADNLEQWSLPAAEHRDWLRLVRSGTVFTGYTSEDGVRWEQSGSVDFGLAAPSSVLLGLAVCSHGGCDPATILFDSLEIDTRINHPPVACIETEPSPATLFLVDGKAEVLLKGTCSSDGDGGTQSLAYLWTRFAGPLGAVIVDRAAPSTRITFTRAGNYRFRLVVDDGGIVNNTASAIADVAVLDQPPPPEFRRGDVDANGALEITDPINLLGFLFLGEGQPPCFDASDADDNGGLEITDAIVILGYLFLGEAPPPAPGPDRCGPDPTEDPPGADFGCAYPQETCL